MAHICSSRPIAYEMSDIRGVLQLLTGTDPQDSQAAQVFPAGSASRSCVHVWVMKHSFVWQADDNHERTACTLWAAVGSTACWTLTGGHDYLTSLAFGCCTEGGWQTGQRTHRKHTPATSAGMALCRFLSLWTLVDQEICE